MNLDEKLEDNMVALGDLNPIDSIRAQLQNQIGYFLQGRQRLQNLMSNSSLQIQGQAQGLYAVQTQLETRLQNEITPIITKVNSGTWGMSDVITLGGFTGLIVKQINDVGRLEKSAGVSVGAGGFSLDMTTVILGGVVVVALAVVSGVFYGGRSQS